MKTYINLILLVVCLPLLLQAKNDTPMKSIQDFADSAQIIKYPPTFQVSREMNVNGVTLSSNFNFDCVAVGIHMLGDNAVENPNAAIQATYCWDKDQNPFNLH